MNVPMIDPNAPTQAEQLELAMEGMKSQLANRLATDLVGNTTLRFTSKHQAESDAGDIATFCITLANKLVENYRPKLRGALIN